MRSKSFPKTKMSFKDGHWCQNIQLNRTCPLVYNKFKNRTMDESSIQVKLVSINQIIVSPKH